MDTYPEDPYVPAALLLCDDGATSCLAVERAVTAAGFEVVANVSRWSAALQTLADVSIDVVVLDLALAGSVGIRIVGVLQAVAPNVEVIVLTPFANIDPELRRSGAFSVIDPSDLRPLGLALRRLMVIRSQPHRMRATTD